MHIDKMLETHLYVVVALFSLFLFLVLFSQYMKTHTHIYFWSNTGIDLIILLI